jgi:hypothetical protein
MGAALWLGVALMVVSEAATLARIEPFWSWNTPIAWTGFILFADAVVFRVRGDSWIRSAPREFAALCLASIPLWLVFELYNRFIVNWYYTGLPENALLRYFGYAWSFATIWPAIFEGAELVGAWRGAPREPTRAAASSGETRVDAGSSRAVALISIAIGIVMLVVPIAWPSQFLAAFVFLGFAFLLDPLNARLGGESLARDFSQGRVARFTNLLLSGWLCGVLWEFWNYWSRAKWHYTVPIMERFKVFEMPLPGYLGFPAFALECFTMYVFVRLAVAGAWRRTLRSTTAGRTIGL